MWPGIALLGGFDMRNDNEMRRTKARECWSWDHGCAECSDDGPDHLIPGRTSRHLSISLPSTSRHRDSTATTQHNTTQHTPTPHLIHPHLYDCNSIRPRTPSPYTLSKTHESRIHGDPQVEARLLASWHGAVDAKSSAADAPRWTARRIADRGPPGARRCRRWCLHDGVVRLDGAGRSVECFVFGVGSRTGIDVECPGTAWLWCARGGDACASTRPGGQPQ